MNDIYFPLPEFQYNRIVGKLFGMYLVRKQRKQKKLYADLSEVILVLSSLQGDFNGDHSSRGSRYSLYKNLGERSKKAQEKLRRSKMIEKGELYPYREQDNEEYVDYLMSRKDYKWAWDIILEDVSRCLGLNGSNQLFV